MYVSNFRSGFQGVCGIIRTTGLNSFFSTLSRCERNISSLEFRTFSSIKLFQSHHFSTLNDSTHPIRPLSEIVMPKKNNAKINKYRGKIDPRFAYLLSLSQKELVTLCKVENAHLISLANKTKEATEKLLSIKDKKLYEEQLKFVKVLETKFFVPISHGIYLPELLQDLKLPFKKGYASVLILSGASERDLANMGMIVRSKAGDVFTAFVPLELVAELERRKSIRYMELSRPLFPTLDNSIPYTQMDTLHTAMPPITGSGVIVGVVDSALDFYHPDFRDAAGNSRVMFLWAQNLIPNATEVGPPTLPNFNATYGVEYDRATINNELTNFNPPTTPAYQTVRHRVIEATAVPLRTEHGTHVAGIAAGNGLGGNIPPRIGAAPGADIIFSTYSVPGTIPTGDGARALDAFSYIFARATQAGQPCVTNFSSGDNQGPHDGTLLGEQFLDALLNVPGGGRAITVSAGNSTGLASHAAGFVSTGATTNLVLNYAFPGVSDAVDIWYDGHDDFSVTLTSPPVGNPPASVVIGPITPGNNLTQTVGTVNINIASILNDPRNGDNFISIIFNGTIPSGAWTIGLTGTTVINGKFQAWVDRNNRYNPAGQRNSSWQAPHLQETTLTLGGPATSRRVLTVGAHDTAPPTPNLANFSGLGPTRDGRIKPEIASVGVNVQAPASHDMNATTARIMYLPQSGTSMSAPHAAGASALLFECRGAAATWADLKQILQQNVLPGLLVPNNGFGFGSMRLGGACTAPQPSVDVWVRDDVDDTGQEPYTGNYAHECPDIQVLDLAGNPVSNPTHDSSVRFNHHVRITVRNRGTQPARNTEVYFYWADPATNLPFPSSWNSAGIFTDDSDLALGTFTQQTNKIVLPLIAPGDVGHAVFAWAPPAPGSNIRGDNHFCLLTRLENESDPSNVGAGGFDSIRPHNNLGLHNVDVQTLPAGGDATSSFYICGSGDTDSLLVFTEGVEGDFELLLPTQVLPIRDAKLIEGNGENTFKTIENYISRNDDARLRHDITGADQVAFRGRTAKVSWNHQNKVALEQIKLHEGQKLPARVKVSGGKITKEKGFIRIVQYSGGRRVGGVTLELRPE